jgi:general secretion pathway protein E
VNSLLFRAAKERASDIHIEPMERELLVRFRIDGVLQEIIKPPKRYQNSIVSRVKVMGQLNIAEKRLPRTGASASSSPAGTSTSVCRPSPARSGSAS